MSSKKKNVGRRDILSALGVTAGALTLGGGARLVTKAAQSGPAAGGQPQLPVAGVPGGAPAPVAPVAMATAPRSAGPAPAPPVVMAPPPKSAGPAPVYDVPTTPPAAVLDLPEPQPAVSADVQAFFGPIKAGTRLGAFTVRSVNGVHLGGVAVVLESSTGRRFQVDVLARTEGARKGVANTPRLSIYLANSGNGQQPSVEAHGQAALALGRALARREQAGARVPALLTLAERGARFPGGVYDGTYLS